MSTSSPMLVSFNYLFVFAFYFKGLRGKVGDVESKQMPGSRLAAMA